MRLKHAQHALAPGVASGRKRGTDFTRMMAVVIDDHIPFAAVLDLEPAASSTKDAKGFRNFGEWDTQFGCKSDHSERVADIVAARNVEGQSTKRLRPAHHAEA